MSRDNCQLYMSCNQSLLGPRGIMPSRSAVRAERRGSATTGEADVVALVLIMRALSRLKMMRLLR
jgi:hypothetical protein